MLKELLALPVLQTADTAGSGRGGFGCVGWGEKEHVFHPLVLRGCFSLGVLFFLFYLGGLVGVFFVKVLQA